MSKLDELASGKAPIYALIVALASGGGYNFISEGSEEIERNTERDDRISADYVQDVTSDNILALLNDMRVDVAIMKQQLEDLTN